VNVKIVKERICFVDITVTAPGHCTDLSMGSTTMKRLLIYYWYNVRWSRLLLILGVVLVAGLLFGPWLFGSQSSQSKIQKSKYGVARYKVISYTH